MIHNAYSPWAELAALPHIGLVWTDLRGRVGEYIHADGVIRLDRRLRRHQARCVLAHELEHALAGDVVTHCGRANLRQEQEADRRAARKLIDVGDLGEAMAIHGERRSAVATELYVSQHVLEVRLRSLHPSERHYLTRRLEQVPS